MRRGKSAGASWLTILAPGILVATTGVGAGDLLALVDSLTQSCQHG